MDDEDDNPTADPALLAELTEAEGEERRLRAIDDTGYKHQRLLQLALSRVWSLRSHVRFAEGKDDAARKAAMTADSAAAMAAKLERESLADRVAALEREVALRRAAGREIDDMEELDSPEEV